MGLSEAAAYLGITDRSLYRFIAQGDLIPVRLPGLRRTLLDKADLEALVATARQRVEERRGR